MKYPTSSDDRIFEQDIGQRIQEARDKKGMLQTELAAHLKITQSTMSRLEGGVSSITAMQLLMCAYVLDVTPNELLGYQPIEKRTTTPSLLLDVRTYLNLTQPEMAAAMGVTAVTISRWETNWQSQEPPQATKLMLLAVQDIRKVLPEADLKAIQDCARYFGLSGVIARYLHLVSFNVRDMLSREIGFGWIGVIQAKV